LGYDITEASLTAKLVAAEIRVIAISTTTGLPLGLDEDPTPYSVDYAGICDTIDGAAGQASHRCSDGGVALVNAPPEEVTTRSCAQNLPADTAMVSDCGTPSMTFDPASQIVISGRMPISWRPSPWWLARQAAPTPLDWATINGEIRLTRRGP
jgi:hypothetical protein